MSKIETVKAPMSPGLVEKINTLTAPTLKMLMELEARDAETLEVGETMREFALVNVWPKLAMDEKREMFGLLMSQNLMRSYMTAKAEMEAEHPGAFDAMSHNPNGRFMV